MRERKGEGGGREMERQLAGQGVERLEEHNWSSTKQSSKTPNIKRATEMTGDADVRFGGGE